MTLEEYKQQIKYAMERLCEYKWNDARGRRPVIPRDGKPLSFDVADYNEAVQAAHSYEEFARKLHNELINMER